MPKPISLAKASAPRIVIVTMDSHFGGAVDKARDILRRQIPGLELSLHAADEFAGDEAALGACHADIARADIIIAGMLFLEDHFKLVQGAIAARRIDCDALVCCLSAPEITRMTRMGRLDMAVEAKGLMGLLKRLRGKKEGSGASGKGQMKMLRELPKLLRFIPGTAQDLRAYFLTLQYWLAGSSDNLANMVALLVQRYAKGKPKLVVAAPVEYPDTGLYHPQMKGRIGENLAALPRNGPNGTVGLLLLRSYVLAGNAKHYDGMIKALEARGLNVIPAFAAGLDGRPAIDAFFTKDGAPAIDALVSLTGFSLVGGPAYNDARAAEAALARLDVPYIAAHPLEFQTMRQWSGNARGLLPVEATMMVAIPELDGGIWPMTFGGRCGAGGDANERCAGCDGISCARDMVPHPERAGTLADRIARMVKLRRTERAKRKVATVLFNFPPNAGTTGTAAYLGVFASLFNTLKAMKAAGYHVTLPESADVLRDMVIHGNRERHGTTANVAARLGADQHVRRTPWLAEIEKSWGPAPGRIQTDGHDIFILGVQLGNAFVGVQPGFGYEGDPMRLLFEQGFAPTHAFSAFYQWIRQDFGADAVLHFGTHGALEFMPGKQAGMSAQCWPDRLIGDLPNYYLYASNNPSEGMLAKRRAGATLISYLTPPIASAGLYRGLLDLKASIDRWRALEPDADLNQRAALAGLIQAQASAVDLAAEDPPWADPTPEIVKLSASLLELEYTLIPHGLHVVGEPPDAVQRKDMLDAAGIAEGADRSRFDALLAEDHEIPALLRALDGRYIMPAPGGDLLRSMDVLPTGRNLHGFDPFKLPSAFAVQDGMRQANRLLERHAAEGNGMPETIAMVLWGTDNLKTEGGPIAQALALMGASPRYDSYGRLAGATLIPLSELGRPRIDVVMTLSGIFRDLLPLQMKLLAEAALLAAEAEEAPEQNFIRKHALFHLAQHGGSMEQAALRVFGNTDGTYGAHVNAMIHDSAWNEEDELAATFVKRKGFAYGVDGKPARADKVLQQILASVEITYQNLDSVEVGVTTIDHYFDMLGGMSRAVQVARGGKASAIYISDQTRGEGKIRTLSEQVTLETRTRALNPKWYEGLLKHGYEGVREIEAHVTNTMGWSATTGDVAPWVYERIADIYVLDKEMRDRMAHLNPTASAKIANRLIEAQERRYWTPSADVLEALRRAGDELEDRIEGISEGVAA